MTTSKTTTSVPNGTDGTAPLAMARSSDTLSAQLVATIIAVVDDEPVVRTVTSGGVFGLPTALFCPDRAASLDDHMRASVVRETGIDVEHVEQLQATITSPVAGVPMFCIGYLALTRTPERDTADRAHWHKLYQHFPWEDWRRGAPRYLLDHVFPCLDAWAMEPHRGSARPRETSRQRRISMCFADKGQMWDEDKVVERFDLMCDAGLIEREAPREHLRCLAVAMSRLRGRIKSRPIVFDLMPDRFTLYELQRTVEAVLGLHLHKQNFRRLVEQMGLVEPTDEMKSHTGGRPAKLFRFRHDCVLDRPKPGLRVRGSRG